MVSRTHTLVVMAAGIGSRYGGIKQIEPVGPAGETITDYSVYDALRAGFNRFVFIIRHDIEDAFHESIGRRLERHAPIQYVFQDIPAWRKKPLGTGQAVLAAEPAVKEPFGVINADDFYGSGAFRVLAEELAQRKKDDTLYATVGYVLKNTLSDHGHVSRGVCTKISPDGMILELKEHYELRREGDGVTHALEDGTKGRLTGNELVNMNMFGFTPVFFSQLREGFDAFMRERGREEKSEFLLSNFSSEMVRAGRAKMKVLPTDCTWLGITNREDLAGVRAGIAARITAGDYPPRLWG